MCPNLLADCDGVIYGRQLMKARISNRSPARFFGRDFTLIRMFVLLATALLANCGGSSEAPPVPVVVETPPALAPNGVAVIKFRAVGSEWAALTERLRPLEDTTAPDRQLLTAPDGTRAVTTIDSPAGWSLIDFALHPSGEMTLVLANNKELRLQRRAANGDPFVGDVRRILDPQALVPQGTRDAVRVEPAGEELLLALRTGRNAVIAQRLTFLGAGNFSRRWRTIVEPGVPIDLVRLTSGTFDPFASLDNQWHVALAVDEEGRSAIAVALTHTELTTGHRDYFHEPIDPALFSGAIVTVLDPTGVRLSATPIDTQVQSEVHALRWIGDTVFVGGRVLTTRQLDGSGWDGLLARLKFGDPVAQLQTLDFDRGDVILDIAALRDGRIVVAGSTAYVQNPFGGSISESAEPLLAVLPMTGTPSQRLVLPTGSRHNQLRTIGAWRERWMIGGLQNGPGTHSGDTDPTLLTCDGYLREQPF